MGINNLLVLGAFDIEMLAIFVLILLLNVSTDFKNVLPEDMIYVVFSNFC